ncbi:MAG TPA: Cof-type HAD-IIB family hydrolase [Chthonomonadaceae bacterium]|nr:Cof-type HAD-IIB family hydrolase [Chthonomonadaceae bacterium]
MIAQSPVGARIRALFLDIDGTLIGADTHVSAGVVAALQAAKAQGCEIILCTGRTRFTMAPIAEQISPLPSYAVTSNGGVALHLGTDTLLYRHLIPIPVALELVQAILEAGGDPYVFEDSDTPGVEGSRVLHHPDRPTGPWAQRPRYRPHHGIENALPFAPVSVSTFGPPPIMRPLAALLAERLSDKVAIIQSGSDTNWGVEMHAPNVSKRLGLETIVTQLGLSREEVVAIGDHINDMEMLEWAGIGVAMGNALPEVKEIADWVTDRYDEDGVARAIERFVLA